MRLKGKLVTAVPASLVGFNSKLVRLKVYTARAAKAAFSMFQFQTGAIKREERQQIAIHEAASFNSKLVRLKVQDSRPNAFINLISFNSKLVRLKDARNARVFPSPVSEFQFQTGAIKRPARLYHQRRYSMFQFQTGAIKRFDNADAI